MSGFGSHAPLSPETKLVVELLNQTLEEVRQLREEVKEKHSNKAYLSVKQFATKIGMSITQVRYWCETGQIKAIQPGGDGTKWKILASELDRLKSQAKENNHTPIKSRKLKKDVTAINHYGRV
jgi:hypothetical protein